MRETETEGEEREFRVQAGRVKVDFQSSVLCVTTRLVKMLRSVH